MVGLGVHQNRDTATPQNGIRHPGIGHGAHNHFIAGLQGKLGKGNFQCRNAPVGELYPLGRNPVGDRLLHRVTASRSGSIVAQCLEKFVWVEAGTVAA